MSISIDLNENGPFTNGDIVSGTVTLDIPNGVSLKGVEVELFGKSYLKNGKKLILGGQFGPQAILRQYAHRSVHQLLCLNKQVFPPKDVQDLSQAPKHTLTAGKHKWDFQLQFPDRNYECDCRSQMNILHNPGYTYGQPYNLPGTFYSKNRRFNHCYIQYSVNARAVTSSLKLNITESQEIRFEPRPDHMTYSLKSLCNSRGQLNPNFDTASKEFRFGRDWQDGRSRSKKSSKIPFQLVVTFDEANAATTVKGKSNRFVYGGGNLSQYIHMRLQTPYSAAHIANMLGSGKSLSRDIRMNLIHIKIQLHLCVSWRGRKKATEKQDWLLIDKPLNLSFSLHAFSNDGPISSINILPEWYDCSVPDTLGQSFFTCNIKRDFELHTMLTFTSADFPEKQQMLKCVSPVVLLKAKSKTQEYSNTPVIQASLRAPQYSDLEETKKLPEYFDSPPLYELKAIKV